MACFAFRKRQISSRLTGLLNPFAAADRARDPIASG